MNLQAGSLKYFRFACALVLSSVALFGTQARTQEVTAGITGTITDPSGSAVVDALVTAMNTQSATTFSTNKTPTASITCPGFLWELIGHAQKATASAQRRCLCSP